VGQAGALQTQAAAPQEQRPAVPSLDPTILKALEEKLAALATHQTSLVSQITDLNSHIAAKDAKINDLQQSRHAGAAADEAAAREARDVMLWEMAKLRDEVVSMQHKMDDASEVARSAAEAKAAALAAEAEARRVLQERDRQDAIERARREAEEQEAKAAAKIRELGKSGSSKTETPLYVFEHAETDGSRSSASRDGGLARRDSLEYSSDDGGREEVPSPPQIMSRRLTMRTPYGEEFLHDEQGADDFDYFVPLMQKERKDISNIFHTAQHIAMAPTPPKPPRQSSGRSRRL
jgi:hypothetical protein